MVQRALLNGSISFTVLKVMVYSDLCAIFKQLHIRKTNTWPNNNNNNAIIMQFIINISLPSFKNNFNSVLS